MVLVRGIRGEPVFPVMAARAGSVCVGAAALQGSAGLQSCGKLFWNPSSRVEPSHALGSEGRTEMSLWEGWCSYNCGGDEGCAAPGLCWGQCQHHCWPTGVLVLMAFLSRQRGWLQFHLLLATHAAGDDHLCAGGEHLHVLL